REAFAGAEEGEQQDVEERPRLVEVAPRERDARRHEQARDRPERRAGSVDVEGDPERDAVRGPPAAEPVDEVVPAGAREQDDGDRGHRHGDDACDEVAEPGRQEVADGREHGGREERQRDRERDEDVHQPRTAGISSGSSVPSRACTCTATASRRASTVTLTTTSVKVRAWTTGSVAFVPSGMPLKIGAVPCLR